MMQQFFRRRGPAPARGPRARRPALEALEERWVPADASQVFALPPGTTIFDLNSAIIRTAEGVRTQIHNAVAADEQQTITQLQQNISVADQIDQAIHGQVAQDNQQLADDAAAGAAATQLAVDLAKAVQDQKTAQA